MSSSQALKVEESPSTVASSRGNITRSHNSAIPTSVKQSQQYEHSCSIQLNVVLRFYGCTCCNGVSLARRIVQKNWKKLFLRSLRSSRYRPSMDDSNHRRTQRYFFVVAMVYFLVVTGYQKRERTNLVHDHHVSSDILCLQSPPSSCVVLTTAVPWSFGPNSRTHLSHTQPKPCWTTVMQARWEGPFVVDFRSYLMLPWWMIGFYSQRRCFRQR